MPYTAGPFDVEHFYLQWGGKLPGGEEWSCGLRMGPVGGTLPPPSDALVAAAKTVVQAYHTAAGTGISPRALLSFVKLNQIDVNGHYVEDVTRESIVADVAGGGIVANTPANQIALAISLTTGVSRGPAHRGRFYLPLPSYLLDANGVFAAANAAAVSGTTDTFVSGLNGLSPNLAVAVFSRKSGAATHRNVTGNQVGVVYDTQRRRRRKLAENYQ